jgi:hypothetical protein
MAKIIPGYKDENGMFVKQPKAVEPVVDKHEEPGDISIDALMGRGLKCLWALIRHLEVDVQHPTRETVQNLKDVMAILKELKKDEKDFLESLSDEELLKLKNANIK